MLEIKNLFSGYLGAQVVNGVDLIVEKGKIVVLIGPNGAGKSTVLKSIFNLAEVYQGEIFFENKNITRFKTYDLIDLGISFVPQGRQIFSNMTVLENLQMGAFTIKNHNIINKKIEEIFHQFPILEEKKKILASCLSGGQQQLLAIARALMQNPRLLLLDEPSLGLSPKITKEIFNKIIEIKNSGVAVLIVEQNVKQAAEIADRIYVLEGGAIALEGGKNVLENAKLKEVYFGGGIKNN